MENIVAPGPIYEMALAQFGKAADIMNLDPDVRNFLMWPQRSLTVNFPVVMDNGILP